MPKTKHLIVSISVGILSGVIVGGLIVSISNKVDWGADQLGNLGTWIAGIGTLAAVVVAVWQTNNANRHAAASASKAQDSIDIQVGSGIDAREYGAVRAIIEHAGNVIGEVNHFNEIAKFQAKFPGDLSTAELLSAQRHVIMVARRAILEVQLAFTQLADKTLLRDAALVHLALDAVIECISSKDPARAEADWPLAASRTVQIAVANSQLLDDAIRRFNAGTSPPAPASWMNADPLPLLDSNQRPSD